MEILESKSTQQRSGILCSSLDEVKQALTYYSEGRSSKSQATHQRLAQDGGGMATALQLLIRPSTDSFLDRMFKELDQVIKRSGRAYLSYDYDGMGTPFFKSSVEVQKIKSNQFVLEMSAAYVGDGIEVGLAEALEVERELRSTGVRLKVGHTGDQFALDFNYVADRLAGIPLGKLTGSQIADEIAAGRPYDSFTPKVMYPGIVTLRDDDLKVTLAVNNVDYDGFREGRHFGSADGILTGPLMSEWEDPSKFKSPVIDFTIITKKQAGAKYGRPPVLDKKLEQKMLVLADSIASCLQ